MKVEVSNGELVDKVSILRIKLNKIKSEEKLKNVRAEFDILFEEMKKLGINENTEEYKELIKVNTDLWEIEDKIRVKELDQEFDEEFIELARSVYIQNDKRFELKKKINAATNSSLFEEKEYVDYKNK
ncbi:MAG: DUF6165 family protein [Melioribacteraceae bacterium]|nr:hypothetical protein [Melioribacteraceae bacterium]MDD3558212.1 DUF6165 family protein [Melioribacteraceae bacterium]